MNKSISMRLHLMLSHWWLNQLRVSQLASSRLAQRILSKRVFQETRTTAIAVAKNYIILIMKYLMIIYLKEFLTDQKKNVKKKLD